MPELLSIGIESIGLRPPLFISVAPSGIVLPITVEIDASWDAVVVLFEPDVQLEVEARPPPSKVEELDVVLLVAPEPLALHVELGAGLSPPGLISVDASGAPAVVLLPLEPMPSGDVVPIPDEVTAVCAIAPCQPQRSATNNPNPDRIEISGMLVRATP